MKFEEVRAGDLVRFKGNWQRDGGPKAGTVGLVLRHLAPGSVFYDIDGLAGIWQRDDFDVIVRRGEDGWYAWAGGDCPVPSGWTIEIKTGVFWRDHPPIQEAVWSKDYVAPRWRHEPPNSPQNITAFRLVDRVSPTPPAAHPFAVGDRVTRPALGSGHGTVKEVLADGAVIARFDGSTADSAPIPAGELIRSDQPKPAIAMCDIRVGDEIVVRTKVIRYAPARGTVNFSDWVKVEQIIEHIPAPRPLKVGDRALLPDLDAAGEILCLSGEWAVVKWDDETRPAVVLAADLSRAG